MRTAATGDGAFIKAKSDLLQRYRRWNASWLGRIDSYLLNVAIGVVVGLYMMACHRVRVYRRERLRAIRLPTIILPNHVSLLDDFFLGTPLLYDRGFFSYRMMPYHAPEEKNFFKGTFLSYLMRKLKCVPLTRGSGFNQPGMQRLLELLQGRNLLWIYPEGTRTRTGEIVNGKAGVGMLLYRSHAVALPVYHEGLHKVLPIGAKCPRFFKRIDVIVGEPVSLDDLRTLPDEPRTWQAIADRIIARLRDLHNELAEIKTSEGRKVEQPASGAISNDESSGGEI